MTQLAPPPIRPGQRGDGTDSQAGHPLAGASTASPVRVPLALAAALATLAAATTLSAVLEGLLWWLLPAAGAVAIAVTGGSLARFARRRVRVPAVLTVLPGLVGGLLYVTALSAPETGRWGLLPTRVTPRALNDVVAAGMHDIKVLVPPVSERPGLVLLIAAGVLVVAVLVDALAVTLRHPAAAGLPLLTLIAVPAAVAKDGVPGFAFALAALGYIGLLLTGGSRLESWGTVIGPDADEVRRGRSSAGRRIGFGAVLAALVLPALIPAGLSRGWLNGDGNGTGSGKGGGATLVVQPLVTIEQQLKSDTTVPLLHVRTNRPEYLRLTALEQYDGAGFRLGRLSAGPETRVSTGLPRVPPGPGVSVETSVVAEQRLAERYLPLPYQPTRVDARGDWRLEAGTVTVLSTHTDTSGLHYAASARVPLPTPAELRTLAVAPGAGEPGAGLSPELRNDLVVGRLDPSVRALLDRLTRSARTPYDAVAAIQAYLRGPDFHYDLQGAPEPGPDALRRFLLVDRRGYCQQFASAMTVLVRAVGLPARVGVGFTQGVQQPDGSWLITNHDAHAWPEVWFPQTGWVRFEPTPRDDSTDAAPPYTTPSPATGPASTAPAPVQPPTGGLPGNGDLSRLPSEDRAGVAPPPVTAPAVMPPSGRTARWADGAVAAGILVLLVAPLPAAVRWRRRRRRLAGHGPELAAGAWREMRDTAVDLHLPGSEAVAGTPRQLAARWAELLSVRSEDAGALAGRATLERLVGAEERRRFRRPGGPDTTATLPAGDVGSLLAALRRSATRRSRARALLWPATVARPAAERTRSTVSSVAAEMRRVTERISERRSKATAG